MCVVLQRKTYGGQARIKHMKDASKKWGVLLACALNKWVLFWGASSEQNPFAGAEHSSGPKQA